MPNPGTREISEMGDQNFSSAKIWHWHAKIFWALKIWHSDAKSWWQINFRIWMANIWKNNIDRNPLYEKFYDAKNM